MKNKYIEGFKVFMEKFHKGTDKMLAIGIVLLLAYTVMQTILPYIVAIVIIMAFTVEFKDLSKKLHESDTTLKQMELVEGVRNVFVHAFNLLCRIGLPDERPCLHHEEIIREKMEVIDGIKYFSYRIPKYKIAQVPLDYIEADLQDEINTTMVISSLALPVYKDLEDVLRFDSIYQQDNDYIFRFYLVDNEDSYELYKFHTRGVPEI